MSEKIIFYQLFEKESSTYTYLIADPKTRQAALIDSVLETAERDLKLINELGLELKYILDTHIHADHITAASFLRRQTKAKSAVSEGAQVSCIDIPLKDHDELYLGDLKITALATPGHTNSCMSFLFQDLLFTGDTLLIRGTGRTDFQQGSAEKLFNSIKNKIYSLSGQVTIYPGHDYKGNTKSTVELEKKFNLRIDENTSKEEFIKTMKDLKLDLPKKIHEAVPANLKCGTPLDFLSARVMNSVPEITNQNVHTFSKKIKIIDVRRSDEFNGELGHIEGAELVTLETELENYLKKIDHNESLIFVCRSGGRSEKATQLALSLGFKNIANMIGGMMKWNEFNLPVVRN